MYRLLFGDNFLSLAEKLDKKLKERLNNNLKILQQIPFHPKLHTKPLHGKLAGFYSFRLGRDYRIIFQFGRDETIALLSVKPRGAIYR